MTKIRDDLMEGAKQDIQTLLGLLEEAMELRPQWSAQTFTKNVLHDVDFPSRLAKGKVRPDIMAKRAGALQEFLSTEGHSGLDTPA